MGHYLRGRSSMIHANLQRLYGVSMRKIYGIGKLNQTFIPAHQSQTEILFALPFPVQNPKDLCAFCCCCCFLIICVLHNAAAFSLYILGVKEVLLLCPLISQRLKSNLDSFLMLHCRVSWDDRCLGSLCHTREE